MGTAKTAAATQDKMQLLSLIKNFFKEFQTCCNRTSHPKAADFDKYLSPKFELFSNGRTLCHSLKDYIKSIEHLQEKFQHLEVSEFHEEPIVADNKIVLQYDIKLNLRNGQKEQVFVIAVAELENNHLVRWTQVTHQVGSRVGMDGIHY